MIEQKKENNLLLVNFIYDNQHTGESVKKYPFRSYAQAVAFINYNNPARQKFVNLLEIERGTKPSHEDFSGLTPRDLWASVVAGVKKVLKDYDYHHRLVWCLRNRGDTQKQLAAEEIAEVLNMQTRTIYRMLRRIREDIERELVRRHLLDPEVLETFK